jgi:hypothetical protein
MCNNSKEKVQNGSWEKRLLTILNKTWSFSKKKTIVNLSSFSHVGGKLGQFFDITKLGNIYIYGKKIINIIFFWHVI